MEKPVRLFADYANLYTGNLPKFGGNWNNGTNAGTFYLNVNYSASNANSNLGTHLTLSSIITSYLTPNHTLVQMA